MDNIGAPIEFFYRFKDSFGKKNSPFVAIGENALFLLFFTSLSAKIFVVINKIDLKAFFGHRSYFNDQRLIDIIDHQVHTGKPDHFVQLMAAFVDTTVPGHEYPHFTSFFLHQTGNFERHISPVAGRQVGCKLRRDIQYPLVFHYNYFNKILTSVHPSRHTLPSFDRWKTEAGNM